MRGCGEQEVAEAGLSVAVAQAAEKGWPLVAMPDPARESEYAYAGAMGLAALAAVVLTVLHSPMPRWYELLAFAVAGFTLGSRTLRISDTVGSVSVGFMFVFAALVELGPLGGAITGAASALGGALLPPDLPYRQRPLVVIAAVCNITLAAAVSGWAYLRLQQASAEVGLTGGILPAFIVTGIYYVINSAGVSLMASPQAGRSAVYLWFDSLSWTVLPFYLGSAAVVAVHVLSDGLGPVLWLALIPVVLLVHFGLVLRTRARVAAQLAEERARGD
jgi:hypothetical protein